MSETKTHWKKFFDYNYMGSYSLDDYQSDPILTIKSVKTEKVKNQDGREEECLVCEWVENEKPMILNKTNCKIIEKVYGSPHVQDWVGKRVQIYAKTVKSFGTHVPALRIREFVPKSNEESKKSETKAKVRELLSKYTGIDKEDIKAELNQAVTSNSDSEEFYQSVIEKLTI